VPPAGPIVLKDLTTDELVAALGEHGASPRLARQIQIAALRHDRRLAPAPGVSAARLAALAALTELPRLELVEKEVSAVDGFARYAFRGAGDGVFEAVRIPLLHRPGAEKYVVCVSSQVGCAMGCVFCATGRLGFVRQLQTWEIVDQVVRIAADSPHPVRGVVFMGMGEPLANYDAVLRAARIFADPCGLAIDGRSISISTVGVAPAMRRFAAERVRFRLILSLTSADPAQRLALIPAEAR
jgi:23S rRNA (adenine2503-C2)-methyltransferase